MRSLLVVLIALIAISSANALNIDSECNDKGFDSTLAKFTWNGEEFQEVYSANDVTIQVLGDEQTINWNSNTETTAAIINEECAYQVLTGGFEGTASVLNAGDNINSVTFCKDYDEDLEEEEEYSGDVPEFGLLAIIFILITSLTFILWRRK